MLDQDTFSDTDVEQDESDIELDVENSDNTGGEHHCARKFNQQSNWRR